MRLEILRTWMQDMLLFAAWWVIFSIIYCLSCLMIVLGVSLGPESEDTWEEFWE